MSWTTSLEIADTFARQKESQRVRGGGVVLEKLARPAAIVCRIEYHPPITDEEIEEIAARDGLPGSALKKLPRREYHDETVYIVDGSAPGVVEIVRRYLRAPRRRRQPTAVLPGHCRIAYIAPCPVSCPPAS